MYKFLTNKMIKLSNEECNKYSLRLPFAIFSESKAVDRKRGDIFINCMRSVLFRLNVTFAKTLKNRLKNEDNR